MTRSASPFAAEESTHSRAHRTSTHVVLAALILAAATGTSAHSEYSESGSAHWLEHVGAQSNPPTERQLAPYGYAAPGAAPSRLIVVGKETRHLNVEQLETVAIQVDGKTVNWTFDAFPRRSFSLSKIIPGADGVTVYVSESPLYRGH